LAVAVTRTHVHLVVRVEGDPDGADLVRDFKSYAARRLNAGWGRPANGSWWSESGSRRPLKGDGNVAAAVEYVARQEGAWLVWYAPQGERPA
jgi:REP element-mobilizing transposase RayT